MKKNYLILNAEVFDDDGTLNDRDGILITNCANGRKKAAIVSAFNDGIPDGTSFIHGDGLVAIPGLCDIGCSIGDIVSSGQNVLNELFASARSGYGLICPKRDLPGGDSAMTFSVYREKAGEITDTELVPSAVFGLENRENISSKAEEMYNRGCRVFYADNLPNGELYSLMNTLSGKNALLVPSVIDMSVCKGGSLSSAVSEKYGVPPIPKAASLIELSRVVYLSVETGCRVLIRSINSAEALELVKEGKRQGGNIYAATAPHYFAVSSGDLIYHGVNDKVCPPLETEKDRAAVEKGIADGDIDLILSDHITLTPGQKTDMKDSAFGCCSHETAFLSALTFLVRKNIVSLPKIVRMMCITPREAIYGKKVSFSEAYSESGVMLADLSLSRLFTRSVSGKSSYWSSVFDGITLFGDIRENYNIL